MQLARNIRSAEEVLAITLDLARNDLINLNLFVSTGALVVGSGAMMGGLFGMNVDVEASTAAWTVGPMDKFTVVTCGILSFSSAVALFCYRRYRRVVRDASHAVQGQATLDRLSLQTKQLTPVLEEAYHLHSTVSMEEFACLLERAGISVTKGELGVLQKLYGDSNGQLVLGLFRATLQQVSMRETVTCLAVSTAAVAVAAACLYARACVCNLLSFFFCFFFFFERFVT